MISPLSLLKRIIRSPRDVLSLTLMAAGLLFLAVEVIRIWPILIPQRPVNILLSSSLMYSSLRIRGREVNYRHLLLVILTSLLVPPILLMLPFLPERAGEVERMAGAEESEEDLLAASFRSILVVCDSMALATSLATSLASHLANWRRIVLVDWSGDAPERLKGLEVRVAKPEDLWLGHPGNLGPSYYMTASLLLSYLSDINPSVIGEALKTGDPSFLQDVRIPEPGRSLLISLLGEGGSLLHEALPEVAGILVIDASELPVAGKDALSLLTLLQAVAYEKRDFAVITPLLSPLTDERAPSRIRDEMRWLISSLRRGGGIVTSIPHAAPFIGEFDLGLECDGCDAPIYRLDSYRLCPLQSRRGGRAP